MSTAQHTIAKGLLALTLLWMINCCTYLDTRFRPKPQEPTLEVKLAAPAAPETPAEVVPSPPPPEPRFYVHVVRWPGATLSFIAQWYTGSWKNWKALADANPALNPNRIVIGDNILIPEDLLKTRKPMPLDFLPSSVRKEGAQTSPAEQPTTSSDEMELFGPMETQQPTVGSDEMELFGPIETQQPTISSDEKKMGDIP